MTVINPPSGHTALSATVVPAAVRKHAPRAKTYDRVKSPWQQQISAAHDTWNRLSLDTLRAIDGRPGQLRALLEQAYGLPPAQAQAQVRAFFASLRASLRGMDAP